MLQTIIKLGQDKQNGSLDADQYPTQNIIMSQIWALPISSST
jgi:hypothetical protein